jgi:hypothetical protein
MAGNNEKDSKTCFYHIASNFPYVHLGFFLGGGQILALGIQVFINFFFNRITRKPKIAK